MYLNSIMYQVRWTSYERNKLVIIFSGLNSCFRLADIKYRHGTALFKPCYSQSIFTFFTRVNVHAVNEHGKKRSKVRGDKNDCYNSFKVIYFWKYELIKFNNVLWLYSFVSFLSIKTFTLYNIERSKEKNKKNPPYSTDSTTYKHTLDK